MSPPSESLSAGVVALAAGYVHTCSLLTGGGAYCWGYNGIGQLGTGDTTDRHSPTAVTGLGAGGQSSSVAVYIVFLLYMFFVCLYGCINIY